jgi:L-alanine-DL-glutamate epimerase-like enolase superfamily enzyme
MQVMQAPGFGLGLSMKITNLRTTVVHYPFDPPIDGGAHMLTSSDCVLVTLETDEGLTGEGLVFALNGQRVKLLHEMILSLAPLVIDLEPRMGGSFATRAFRDVGFIGRTGLAIFGIAGIDDALWDLRAKAANLNVSQLIGGYRKLVPAYHSGGLWISRSVDELQREASDFVAQGWRAMKMRLGKPSAEEDAARVRAVREAIGPDIALMADSNQQLDVGRAIRLGRMLEEYNLQWFEEPIAYENHEGEARLTATLDMPIASGETEYTSRGMHEMLKRKSADILMPDLQRMGGPTEFLKAAAIADGYNIPISSHLFPEMSLSLLAAIPNGIFLEYMPWCEPFYAQRITLDDNGCAIVPDRTGWGFSFDPAAVRRYRV